MVKTALLFIILIFSTISTLKAEINPNYTIWFDSPATIWEESLPQGNGRLGIMADGGIYKENIVLNEISLWGGAPYDYSNPEASKYLPWIRQLLFEGKNSEAQEIMYEHFVPKKSVEGGTYGSYQLLGNLNISYDYGQGKDSIIDYQRELDLLTGLSETRFSLSNGMTYTRKYAVPSDADGIILEYSSSKPGNVNLEFTLSRPERGRVSLTDGSILMMQGELDSGLPEIKGMEYLALAGCKAEGPNFKIETPGDSAISISGADKVWICLSATTSFDYSGTSKNNLLNDNSYKDKASDILEKILKDPENAVYKGVLSHQNLMNRVELVLQSNENSFLPTPVRLEKFQDDDTDASLAALYYNFGRYLLISSCRENLLPPNLQGLWSKDIQTPWNGDYHTNINVQMNHWITEPGNLSELHLPLAELVKRSVVNGEKTAKSFYGEDAEGWVMHMMTNVWNYTEPGEHPSWGATNTGGAWLCNHLWQHYEYTGDKDFLVNVFPVMKGASEFFLSTMVTDPVKGWMVTSPSSSPENAFYSKEEGNPVVSVAMGPAMDTQIIRELWNNTLQAAEILNIKDPLIEKIKVSLPLLPPNMISSDGRLMEWLEEYEEVDPQHRHVSHLYGLYPGKEISVSNTPELAEAAKETLKVRGDEGTGWSRAWKVNFYARLLDGQHAWKVFSGLLQPAISKNSQRRRAGTFPNLFCSHPPFQIDGNFGGAAGIGEMLVQSHEGFIRFLPAIDEKMANGELKGFKTIGGTEIDMEWENSMPKEITLKKGYSENAILLIPDSVNSVINKFSREKLIIPYDRKLSVALTPNPVCLQFFE